jgi:hypothetical protein
MYKFNLPVELKDSNYCDGCKAIGCTIRGIGEDCMPDCNEFDQLLDESEDRNHYIRLEECKQKHGVE